MLSKMKTILTKNTCLLAGQCINNQSYIVQQFGYVRSK